MISRNFFSLLYVEKKNYINGHLGIVEIGRMHRSNCRLSISINCYYNVMHVQLAITMYLSTLLPETLRILYHKLLKKPNVVWVG